MSEVEILITVLDAAVSIPRYGHPGDAGVDLQSRVEVTLAPGMRTLVPTGIAIALPAGFAAFVHPRSGLANKHGIGMVNAPGTIDAGYRGEIGVLLINHDRQEPFTIKAGDRIAQLIVQKIEPVVFHQVDRLPGSHRGDGGFGSTGTAAPSSP